MTRLTPSVALAEDLTVEVFRRHGSAEQPSWLAARSTHVQLQFTAITVHLRRHAII